MTDICYLSDLKREQKAVVVKLNSRGSMRRRLQDIGIVEGTRVICVGKSPLGDPTAYLIKGAVIALREEDSGKIMVQVQ